MLALFLLPCALASAGAQPDSALKVLIVTAHPDDDFFFAATVYRITHDLKGKVDLALITNGEGGYKYSSLGNIYYGLELTDPAIGRQYLPAIRKQELMNGGRIIGIRNYFFLDQQDKEFTLNVDSVFRYVWDMQTTRKRLRDIMLQGDYDYVFGLLPTEETHGHHKGATILALETARDLPEQLRPVVLGGSSSRKSDTIAARFTGLKGYPVTSVAAGSPSFSFDKTQKFGFRNALDYRIVVNWLIAEHKSQGTMQLLMNRGDIEEFWFFDANDRAKVAPPAALFERLARPMFEAKEY